VNYLIIISFSSISPSGKGGGTNLLLRGILCYFVCVEANLTVLYILDYVINILSIL